MSLTVVQRRAVWPHRTVKRLQVSKQTTCHREVRTDQLRQVQSAETTLRHLNKVLLTLKPQTSTTSELQLCELRTETKAVKAPNIDTTGEAKKQSEWHAQGLLKPGSDADSALKIDRAREAQVFRK